MAGVDVLFGDGDNAQIRVDDAVQSVVGGQDMNLSVCPVEYLNDGDVLVDLCFAGKHGSLHSPPVYYLNGAFSAFLLSAADQILGIARHFAQLA